MTQPMSEFNFYRLVKKYKCTVEMGGSHGKVKKGDCLVSMFAVSHKKGGRREIKPIYVRQFLKAIEVIGSDKEGSDSENVD